MSERTFRRWTRRLGRRSGRAVPDEAAEAVERLYRERYAGFTAKHLVERHGFRWEPHWLDFAVAIT